MSEHLISAYKPLPVSFTRGDGIYLWDNDEKQYFDALCGISVTSLGHNYPAVTEAIKQQAGNLLHTSNIYNIEWQQKLADLIAQLSGMDRVFFGNSGAEANEAAIKLARLYGNQLGIKDPQIVVMQHSFHGRTMGIGHEEAIEWGTAFARCQLNGYKPPVIDSLLAAIALTNGLTLVTRNEKDFRPFGVEVLNPWKAV